MSCEHSFPEDLNRKISMLKSTLECEKCRPQALQNHLWRPCEKPFFVTLLEPQKKSKFYPFLKNIAAAQYLQGFLAILGIQMTH